jgi:F-type H+-transporting ATPase subunit delta
MSQLVAKKYVKGLMKAISNEEIELYINEFSKICIALMNEKAYSIVTSPDVSKAKKEEFILSLKDNNDKKYENFIKLLSDKKRILAIPYILEELKSTRDSINKQYVGSIYSNEDISSDEISSLEASFSKKLEADIKLNFEKKDVDGIKVDIDALGIEIGFSKQKVQAAMLEHILKAI